MQKQKKRILEENFWLTFIKMTQDILETVKLPETVNADIDGYRVKISGPKGDVIRRMASKLVSIKVEDNKVILIPASQNRKCRRVANTFRAHIKNSIRGVMHGFEYKLKICSGHFPMNVTVDKSYVKVSNFLGEKMPRLGRIIEEIKVRVD